jgi:hypothetical protein
MMNHFASHGINQPNKFNGYKDISIGVIELAIKDLGLADCVEKRSAVKFFRKKRHKIYCHVAGIDPIVIYDFAMDKIGEKRNDGNNSNNDITP